MFTHLNKYICICGSEFANSQAFNGHKSHCKKHQLNKYGNLDKLNATREHCSKKISQTLKNKYKLAYEISNSLWISEKHTCEKCGKIMTEKFGSGRFCSRSCSNSHIVSDKTRAKQRNYYKKQSQSKSTYKICKACGKRYTKLAKTKTKFCSKYCKSMYNKLPTLIKYFGLDKDAVGHSSVFEEIKRIKQTLYDLYWVQNLTSSEIIQIFNYPSAANLTAKIFKYLEIPVRNNIQATHLNYLKGHLVAHPNFNCKQCYHTSWDNKQVFLRSSYELDYAKKLDEYKVLYEVESKRIIYFDSQENKLRVAIPDFYLVNTNELVEIKSSYTLNVQNMIDKAAEYLRMGYKFKLILDFQEVTFEDLCNMNP